MSFFDSPLVLWCWQSPFKVKAEKSIIDTLADMPLEDPWNDAELWTIYAYVRSSKLLCIPEAFKAVLFTHAS